MNKFTLVFGLLATGTLARAFTFADIQFWVGTGANQSAVIIDFQNSGGNAYAWGYRYDGAKNGLDMMRAIDAADPNLTLDIVSYSFGDAVNGIRYNNLNQAGFVNNSYWSYWTGPNATTWTSSNVGAGDRPLANGSWDGWSWGNGSVAPRANIVAAPVPEPASLIALALGGLALVKRRRKA